MECSTLRNASIQVACIRAKHASSPDKVLARMQKRLGEAVLRKGDEAWLVVDKDQWTDEQLNALHGWASSGEQFGLALSNPKFEFWLLLHFEDGKGVSTGRQCDAKLARFLPNYDKGFDVRKITHTGIRDAIQRAKGRDYPPCDKWPVSTGSTVYRLVEHLQQEA